LNAETFGDIAEVRRDSTVRDEVPGSEYLLSGKRILQRNKPMFLSDSFGRCDLLRVVQFSSYFCVIF